MVHLLLFFCLLWGLVSTAGASSPLLDADLPAYIIQSAPLLWLYSEERYMPSDLATHLSHTNPVVNGITLEQHDLTNLDTLNTASSDSSLVYLPSQEGIRALPSWFRGTSPYDGYLPDYTRASAIIIVPKPDRITDVFYFYFYSYNQGNLVLGAPFLEFGDHVGDWEHNMVRFRDGEPESMWFSQHEFGQAFAYNALEKDGYNSRPIVYVANGTHAVYATPGSHDHTIPDLNTVQGPLLDHTDKGELWDPTINAFLYTYDIMTDTFTAVNGTGNDPIGWLKFNGRWGDAQLGDDQAGQINILGQRKYVAGPTGPRDKHLDRKAVCPREFDCWIRPWLTA